MASDNFIRSKIADPAWAPYCLMCSTMGRMTRTAVGWKCEGAGDHFSRPGCGNEITRDLHGLRPLTPHERFCGEFQESFAA